MNAKITKTESITHRTMLAVEKMNRISARWLTENEQYLTNRAVTQSAKNQDAAILYLLHTEHGFTGEQLREFFNKFREKYGFMETDFNSAVEDIPEVQHVRNLGFDLNDFYGEE